jgi:hypothetical protein
MRKICRLRVGASQYYSIQSFHKIYLIFQDERALHEKWYLQLIDSSLRISAISALNIPRNYSYAEITEIRRDRRRGLQIPSGTTFRAKLD